MKLSVCIEKVNCLYYVAGMKQKWVPITIEHKSGRNRRSRSAGRAPRNSAMAEKNNERNKPERQRLGMCFGIGPSSVDLISLHKDDH